MKYAAVCCIAVISIALYIILDIYRGSEGIKAICIDGTVSLSTNRKGTCANHGGVKEWR